MKNYIISYIYLFTCLYIIFPQGLFSQIKTILLFFLFLLFILDTIINLKNIYYKKYFIYYVVLILFIFSLQILNSVLKNFYEYELLLELKSFLGLISIIVITLYYSKHININKYFKLIINTYSIYIIIKILLYILLINKNNYVLFALKYISKETSFNYLAGNTIRLVFVNDILSPIIVLILLIINIKNKLFYFIINILNILITFSRYYVVIIIIGFCFYVIIFKKSILKNIKKIIILLVLIFAIILLNSDLINSDITNIVISVWEHRLTSEGKLSSNEKMNQYSVFISEITKNIRTFLFGNGLGTFIRDYIRDKNIRYGYEAFIMLLLYQFGIICFLILLLFYLAIFIKNVLNDYKNKYKVYILILAILLFSNSFVNPQVLNSFFSIPYVLLALLSTSPDRIKKENKDEIIFNYSDI